MKEGQLTKSDLEESAKIFKVEILQNENRISYLKELGSKNNFPTKKSLRPIAWKIFLETLPSSTSENNNIIKEWVDKIISQREEYKKKVERYCSLKKLGLNDPLLKLDNKNEEKTDLLYNEEEKSVINLIQLDLQRTHQALDLFQTTKTKNILSNVLFVYAKKYWGDIPYGQGMNELVSMIYICLYPYYFSSKEKINKEQIYEYLNDIDKYYKEIYLFFHDEDQIQSDLFYLFEALEKKGVNDIYQRFDIKPIDPNYHLYELFPDIIIDRSDEDRTNYLNLRAYTIFKEKLRLIDSKLFSHLKRINVKCNYYMHRWIKCMFSREFDLDDVLILWDKIFFYQFNSGKKYKYSLVYIDFICTAMLVKIRYELLRKKDDGDAYTLIFAYPKDNSITYILSISEKIAEIIEKKLDGEYYDVNEVLRMIKRYEKFNEIDQDDNYNDDDVNDELIIKPHSYNQKNKSSIISCDKNKEIIIFCGKYYIKTKLLLIFFSFLIAIIIFIWIYKSFANISQQ